MHKVAAIGIGGSLAAPPLPHHRAYGSVHGGSRSCANTIGIQHVLAGRSGSCTAESDSMSSRNACLASPVGADEKSSLNWKFSRLSLSRFMSYLPLLSFGPSVTVPGLAYLLTPPFGMSASLALPTTSPNTPSADFCPAVRMPRGILSRRSDTGQISWGKLSRLPRTVAESTLCIFDGYGLRGRRPARPTLAPCIRFLSIDSRVCSMLPSDTASRR